MNVVVFPFGPPVSQVQELHACPAPMVGKILSADRRGFSKLRPHEGNIWALASLLKKILARVQHVLNTKPINRHLFADPGREPIPTRWTRLTPASVCLFK